MRKDKTLHGSEAGEFEKSKMAGFKADREYMADASLLDGDKACRNINCTYTPFGAPQPTANFYKTKTTPDGYDYYCKECRREARRHSAHRNPGRFSDAYQRAQRKYEAKRKAARHELKDFLSRLCNKHPEIPIENRFFIEDCEYGECGKRPLDHRFGKRSKLKRQHMSEALKGRAPGNLMGKNRDGRYNIFHHPPKPNNSRDASQNRRLAQQQRRHKERSEGLLPPKKGHLCD